MKLISGILYFVALGIIMIDFYKSYNNFYDKLQQKFIGNSTETILAKNYLNFANIVFTGTGPITPEAFSGKNEIIYIKISDTSIATNNLNDYTTIHNIRTHLSGFCLKYSINTDPYSFICKLQQ